MQGDGEQLDLYCHGSLKNQEKTTVKIGRKNTGLSSFSLECKDGKFVGVEDKVTCTLGVNKNETLVFVNFSARDASILKICVPIIKRRSWGFQNTPNL